MFIFTFSKKNLTEHLHFSKTVDTQGTVDTQDTMDTQGTVDILSW